MKFYQKVPLDKLKKIYIYTHCKTNTIFVYCIAQNLKYIIVYIKEVNNIMNTI